MIMLLLFFMFSNVNNTVPCHDILILIHRSLRMIMMMMLGEKQQHHHYHSCRVVYHNQQCQDMAQCCLHLKTLGEKQQQTLSFALGGVSQSTVLFTFENIWWKAASSSSFAFSDQYITINSFVYIWKHWVKYSIIIVRV